MTDTYKLGQIGSQWGTLSPHLIAKFFEVEKYTGPNNQTRWRRVPDSKSVAAPLNESSSLEMVLNWQSPFEHAGPESKAPQLLAMLQSNAIQPIVNAANEIFGKDGPPDSAEAQKKSNAFFAQFEGRTGITKLNSTQVFSGMPPLKFQVVALFRAWNDPSSEVEQPLAKLAEWALPKELHPDGTMLKSLIDATQGKTGYVEALMPSRAPTVIGLEYKARVFMPLVIESMGVPLNSGVNEKGQFVELAIPLTLCSLTAMDRSDWKQFTQM